MTEISPVPRRVSRPRWLDVRLVLGVVLVLGAVLVGALVVAHARHTDKQVALTRDLGAGTRLQADDLTLVDVQLPDAEQVYVQAPAHAIGRVLAQPLAKGELLPSAALVAAPARTTVTVPFDADAAPELHRGQRIVVWLSTRNCPSVVLLTGVTIQDVHAADPGSFASGGNGQAVTMSVSADLADRVVAALAMPDATIRAGVLSGNGRATELPALDACTATPSP